MTCNDAMMRILQALIISTTSSGPQSGACIVVRANNSAGTCAMCTVTHINKVITGSLIIHTLKQSDKSMI